MKGEITFSIFETSSNKLSRLRLEFLSGVFGTRFALDKYILHINNIYNRTKNEVITEELSDGLTVKTLKLRSSTLFVVYNDVLHPGTPVIKPFGPIKYIVDTQGRFIARQNMKQFCKKDALNEDVQIISAEKANELKCAPIYGVKEVTSEDVPYVLDLYENTTKQITLVKGGRKKAKKQRWLNLISRFQVWWELRKFQKSQPKRKKQSKKDFFDQIVVK